MDRKYIDDHHVVARYLADQLSEDERTAFEAYYLEHPELLQDLEATARFKVGLAQLRDSGQLQDLIRPAIPRPHFARFAAAACIAIVAVGVSVWVARGPGSLPMLVAEAGSLSDRLGRPLTVTAPYLLERTRSASYDAQIELPEGVEAIELRVLPEVEATTYRLALFSLATDDTPRRLAEVGGLVAQSDGRVPVFLNSGRLSRGRYQLVLSNESGPGAAPATSSFLIKVTLPGEPALRN